MIRVRRALFSAYHKEGLLPLAQEVVRWGGTLLSSGGTASFLDEANLPVTTVEEVTGLGSLFGGRVKTLHPLIHGAILFRREIDEDVSAAREAGIDPIDLVVVNLYPFASALARGASDAEAIELIDIGGPALVRGAAKNHASVAVVTLPEDYARVRAALAEGEGSLSEDLCRELAGRAFGVTAAYDAAIASYFEWSLSSGEASPALPEVWQVTAPRRRSLRYGENPSQLGALYGSGEGFPFDLEQLHGKELSYNNLLDLACGRDVLAEFADRFGPTAGDRGRASLAVVIKHGIPCGVALDSHLTQAYRRARDADSLSAFGGVVLLSDEVDAATAEILNETFLEVVLAPGYAPEALSILEKKKNRVLLRGQTASLFAPSAGVRGRFVGSGFLLQTPMPPGLGEPWLGEPPLGKAAPGEPRAATPAAPGRTDWTVVTRRAPDERERADLLFGWRVLKHVRSNGVLMAKEGRTVGVGSGQCSRIDSTRVAIAKAGREGLDLAGAVLVSDAFFPFRDSIDAAAEAGVTAVLQPGGSVRDEESIQACNEKGLAMVLNGARIFSHG